MEPHDHSQLRAQAVEQLAARDARHDARRVVDSFSAGLTLLSDAYYTRAYLDVQRTFGQDSMMLRTPPKGELSGKQEIDVYLAAEAAHAAVHHKLVQADLTWLAHCLAGLRLCELAEQEPAKKRLAAYVELPSDARRLAFSRVLDRALPESRRAPLVLSRLVPLAAGIVSATAFGNTALAHTLRKQQISLLPEIDECHECRARVLDNGEACPQCGNPLWKLDWLVS